MLPFYTQRSALADRWVVSQYILEFVNGQVPETELAQRVLLLLSRRRLALLFQNALEHDKLEETLMQRIDLVYCILVCSAMGWNLVFVDVTSGGRSDRSIDRSIE